MRVVVGEDETLLREGLTLLLSKAGFDVVAAVSDAPGLVAAAYRHRPDVTITDIRMPPTGSDDGLRAGLSLRERLPDMGLLIVSGRLSTSYAVRLLSRGVGGVGYLWKQRIADSGQFAADVRTVGEGGTVLDPDLTVAALAREATATGGIDRLSPRQLEVLTLVARGLTNAAIAAALYITEKSVVEHVSRIYDLLGLPVGAHRRVLAASCFLGTGQRMSPPLGPSRAA